MSDEINTNTRLGVRLAMILMIILVGVIGVYATFFSHPAYFRSLRLECPYCNETSVFGVTRHPYSGVSHDEVLYCHKCGCTFPVTVYYDGVVSVRQWRDER